MARYFGTPIQLAADPASAMQAATKQYVDAAALDAARQPGYPVDQYGFVAVTFPLECVSTATAVTVNTIEIARIYVPANKAITGAGVNVATAGVTPGSSNASGFLLYSDDGQTQVASHTNDYTIFTTAGWRFKAFTSQVAAQSVGKFYRLAMVHTCTTTAPKFGTTSSTASSTWNFLAPSGTHRRQIFQTSVTSFPATFAPASYGTNDNPLICMGLY